MNENTGLFLVTSLFGVMIGLFAYYIGYEHGFDSCFIEMKDAVKIRYGYID